MRSLINKRGEQFWIMVTLFMALVTGALIILGLLGFLNPFFNSIGFVTGQSQQVFTTLCQEIASNGGDNAKVSYCENFEYVEINDEYQYVTCSYSVINNNVQDKIECGTTSTPEIVARTYCKESPNIKASNWDDLKVNGQTCSNWYYEEPEFPKDRSKLAVS